MRTLVSLQKNSHIDLVAATPGVEQGDSIALQNVDNVDVWVYESEAPASSAQGQLVRPGEHLVTPRGTVGVFAVAVRGDSGLSAGPTPPFQSFRVDNEPIALVEGRQFRAVRKIVVSAGTPLVWKFSALTDFQLIEQQLSTSEGDIELRAYREADVTEGGTFGTPVAIFGKNTTNRRRKYEGDFYQRQNSITTGGTITLSDPEAYVDYDRSKTSNATAQQVSVNGSENSLRDLLGDNGVGTATNYYLEFRSLNGTSEGRFALAWTEYA